MLVTRMASESEVVVQKLADPLHETFYSMLVFVLRFIPFLILSFRFHVAVTEEVKVVVVVVVRVVVLERKPGSSLAKPDQSGREMVLRLIMLVVEHGLEPQVVSDDRVVAVEDLVALRSRPPRLELL